jgi:hypothetical protein
MRQSYEWIPKKRRELSPLVAHDDFRCTAQNSAATRALRTCRRVRNGGRWRCALAVRSPPPHHLRAQARAVEGGRTVARVSIQLYQKRCNERAVDRANRPTVGRNLGTHALAIAVDAKLFLASLPRVQARLHRVVIAALIQVFVGPRLERRPRDTQGAGTTLDRLQRDRGNPSTATATWCIVIPGCLREDYSCVTEA